MGRPRPTQEGKTAQGEDAVLAEVEAWPEPDRSLFLGLHALVRAEASELTLRQGVLWPVAFALTQLTLEEGTRIRALVRRALDGPSAA
ncbi:hypothetical protein FJNA_22780 [Thermus sp. FJN-A]